MTTGGPYDIKSWPEFQKHSFFVFRGELVSRDALGNILAGYLSKKCGCQYLMLKIGAGENQLKSRTAKGKWFWNFFDDPRDSKRVDEGISIYWEMNE